MVQFAPIKKDVDGIPGGTQGVVGNIYIWDITSPQINDANDVDEGFFPADMLYSFTDPLWFPGDSAFLSTWDEYNNFKEQKIIEFANQIPDGLLIGFQPGETIEDKIKFIKLFLQPYLPKFYFLNNKITNINDIKFEYCRYDFSTSEFIDCGLAENHELVSMNSNNGKLFQIRQFPITLEFGPHDLCDHCFSWIVYCGEGTRSDLNFSPSDDYILKYLNENNRFNKKFKSVKQAKKFYEEEAKKTKWIVVPTLSLNPEQTTRCIEVASACAEYNEDRTNCGPFDTLAECKLCETRLYCDYDEETDSTECIPKTGAVASIENPGENGYSKLEECERGCDKRWYCRPNGDCEQLYPEDLPPGDTRYGYFLESRCNEECTKAWFCIEGVIPFCDKLDKDDPAVEGLTPYETIEQCEEICGNPSTSSSSAI